MIDIRNYPYFGYNSQIDYLMKSLKDHAHIEMLGFRRMYKNRERFLICHNHEWAIDFYAKGLYQFCPYEKEPNELISSYDIWDQTPYRSPEIYISNFLGFGLAHGLTIIEQHENHSDSFVFASKPGNILINNFYLNQKALFALFINDFYDEMAKPLMDLSTNRFAPPKKISLTPNFPPCLSPRQQDCANLLFKGASSKEIAGILQLSHRTIDCYINSLKKKFQAKNRIHLIGILGKTM